jgi:hypothetical protein
MEAVTGRATSNRVPDPHAPAPMPDESVEDDPLPDVQTEYRCDWCFGYLPADGLCRCAGSLRDLEQTRLEQRYELGKD